MLRMTALMPFIVVWETASIVLLSDWEHPIGDKKNAAGYVFIEVRRSHELSKT